MDAFTKNWKTTVVGVAIVLIAAAKTFLGINIPGAMDLGPAFTVAVGLFVAKDASTPSA